MTNYAIIDKLNEIKNLIQNNLSDRWLNIEEVCKYSGLSVSTIHRAIYKDELKVSKKTGKNLFRISWVDRWLSNG